MKTTILNLFEVFTVLYKLVLASATFNLVHADKTIVADHPIKCCRAAYSCGTVYFAAQGDCNPFFLHTSVVNQCMWLFNITSHATEQHFHVILFIVL